jgi:hypothetical protein
MIYTLKRKSSRPTSDLLRSFRTPSGLRWRGLAAFTRTRLLRQSCGLFADRAPGGCVDEIDGTAALLAALGAAHTVVPPRIWHTLRSRDPPDRLPVDAGRISERLHGHIGQQRLGDRPVHARYRFADRLLSFGLLGNAVADRDQGFVGIHAEQIATDLLHSSRAYATLVWHSKTKAGPDGATNTAPRALDRPRRRPVSTLSRTSTAVPATKRPHYLQAPCPPWCEASHEANDARADRRHTAYTGWIELSLYDAAASVMPGEYEPETLGVLLEQHVENAEPAVVLYRENDDVRLTLDEAEQLAERLDWIRATTAVERPRKHVPRQPSAAEVDAAAAAEQLAAVLGRTPECSADADDEDDVAILLTAADVRTLLGRCGIAA